MLSVARHTLSNGLRIIVLKLPHLHSVAHALMVRSGPRYETPEQNGISHLVEHLLFRGTERHPSSFAINSAVEALGAEINGLTQRDATTIHMTVPPRTALEGLELLGEICTRPILTGLEVERQVVIEEILDSLDASGTECDMDTLARQAMWSSHPIGMSVAGTPKTVEGITIEECRAHYERTFVARNSVLCVAGPVSEEDVFEVAERAFSAMPAGEVLPELGHPKAADDLPIQVQETDDSQVSVSLSFPAPHENDQRFSTLFVLRRILDDGLASRLRQALCEQGGLTYSMSASIDAYSDIGALDIDMSCSPRKLIKAMRRLLETLRAIAEDGVTQEELNRAQIRHKAELEFGLDDPSELCGWYGATELIGCRSSYEDRLTEVLATTKEDIQALARELFQPDRALLTLVGPVDEDMTAALEKLLGKESDCTVWLGDENEEDTEIVFEHSMSVIEVITEVSTIAAKAVD